MSGGELERSNRAKLAVQMGRYQIYGDGSKIKPAIQTSTPNARTASHHRGASILIMRRLIVIVGPCHGDEYDGPAVDLVERSRCRTVNVCSTQRFSCRKRDRVIRRRVFASKMRFGCGLTVTPMLQDIDPGGAVSWNQGVISRVPPLRIHRSCVTHRRVLRRTPMDIFAPFGSSYYGHAQCSIVAWIRSVSEVLLEHISRA